MAAATFAGVAFDILVESSMPVGQLDWDAPDHVVTRQYPGASGDGSTSTQALGVGSGTKRYRLMFANQTAWAAFLALRQTVGTLVDWDGTSYSNVLLERIEQPHKLPDGRQFCWATFRQAGG
jgi:hypothetical protein